MCVCARPHIMDQHKLECDFRVAGWTEHVGNLRIKSLDDDKASRDGARCSTLVIKLCH